MAISKTYTFTNGTIIDPDEVNENFDDTLDEIKGSHHRDADGSLLEPADVHDDWGLVPKGGVILWSGSIATVPDNYSFCNGSNGTNDMRNKFIVCPGQDSGGTYDTGDTGGSATINISHTHTGPSHAHSTPSHAHSVIGNTGQASSSYGSNTGDENYQGSPQTHSHAISFSTSSANGGNTGAGGTGNTGSKLSSSQSVLPPYKAVVYIQLTNL